MTKIEETLERGGSLRTTKKELAIGRDRMHALRDESGNVKNNMDEIVIVKVAERFYAHLYASDGRPGNSTESTSLAREVPRVTEDAARDYGITRDLLKDGEDIVLGKLAKLFSKCLGL